MSTIGDRVRRITSNECILEDVQYQANLYKLTIEQFIIEQSNKREMYCMVCYENSKSNNLSPECHIPAKRDVIQHIIDWLRSENLRIVDQEDQSCILIGLR